MTFLERMAAASRERVRRARAAESDAKLARRAERIVRRFAAREVRDRALHLLVGQAHALHDAARDAHLVLRDTAVYLRDLSHHLERHFEEQSTDLANGALPARAIRVLIPLMTDENAEQRADGPGDHRADEPTDTLAEPLHRISAYAPSRRSREVAETRREGSLSWL